MTTGRYVAIMKDPEKGITPENDRPIAFLPVIWKLKASVIANGPYVYLESQRIVVKEQMDCHKNILVN